MYFVIQGSYSDSRGNPTVRQSVAQYIEERDGFKCETDNVFISTGASDAIRVRKICRYSEQYNVVSN